MSFYLLRPCKTTAAYEALPNDEVKLDLEKVTKILEGEGMKVTYARVILIAHNKGIETTIYPSGKLLVKTDSEDVAQAEAELLYGFLL